LILYKPIHNSPTTSLKKIQLKLPITPELQSRFDIFPNPVNDKLSVEYISMSKTCDFVVYDMNGKIVQQITRNEALGYFVLDVSNLKSGNYILYSPQLSEKKQFVVKR